MNVANSVNYNANYFKLDVDIDLNNHPWTPIALNGMAIGAFDGQHHKITGLNVDIGTGSVGAGLFGKVKLGVSNLHVSGTVKTAGSGSYAGGICGNITGNGGSPAAVLANCSFTGSVEGVSSAGGIVGKMQSVTTITSCKNSGTVKANGFAGGISGSMGSSLYIFGCYNEGAIIGNNAGGISVPGNAKISGCYNIGTVTGTGTSGAITPSAASVLECYVKAKIGTDSGGETAFGDGAWPTSTNGAVWFAAPDNDGTYTKNASDEPTGDYKFWKSLGSWNGGTPQHPKLWWEE